VISRSGVCTMRISDGEVFCEASSYPAHLRAFVDCMCLLRPGEYTGVAVAQAGGPTGHVMLTIFLRHDESKTLDQINEHLKQTGFTKNFPPKGVEVVSWYVMMGIGQVVTLRFPAERLREVNLVIEHGAWGAFRTDFYPTYDYKPIWQQEQRSQK